jgi:hypothetical protein
MGEAGKSPLTVVVAGIVLALACSTADMPAGNVAVHQLEAGDANCPEGGVAITSGATTAFACNGARGPQGAEGAQGATGGGLYTGRENVYCDSSTQLVSGTVRSSCRSESDLPLAGSCEPSSVDNIVTEDRPEGWQGPTPGFAASWICQFSTSGGTLIGTGTPGTAWVCCVAHL